MKEIQSKEQAVVYQTMQFLGIRIQMPSLQNKMLMKEEENLLILIFCLLYIYSKDTMLANT